MVLTFAMAMRVENIRGAIQCEWGGPKHVHAKPNNPIVSRGAAVDLTLDSPFGISTNVRPKATTYCREANTIGLPAEEHVDLSFEFENADE